MANDPDVRGWQRLRSFRQAFTRLSQAVALSRQRGLSELEQQGLIQAFEFTFELGWLTLQDYLRDAGWPALGGPKAVVRQAFASELIEDGEVWISMITSRNQTSHSYNERIAGEIAAAIFSQYVPAFTSFLSRFDQLAHDES